MFGVCMCFITISYLYHTIAYSCSCSMVYFCAIVISVICFEVFGAENGRFRGLTGGGPSPVTHP